MTFSSPAHLISRWSVVGMEGMWAKMFDPPKESPPTPDMMTPTNPVPEVMAAAGLQDVPSVANTVQRDLHSGLTVPAWDGTKNIEFFTLRDGDNPVANGTFPGPTIRVPRGAIYHCESQGHGGSPHTIHWHGQEPTPANDGVGHCSFEVGRYVYQWQPSFIGTYFYHCHRNTVQHFEFGLYGATIIEPSDAYFATQQNPAIPIGHCRDGRRRTAANLSAYPQFPGYQGNPLDDPDPLGEYPTDPHAQTVAYDVEVLWVPDDRDSVWSDLATSAKQTYPVQGPHPGYDDNFFTHAGDPITPADFFAFNDFNADYFFVTGVPVPAPVGGRAAIPVNSGPLPPEMNSGVSGTQVAINAKVGDTILVRCIGAAYNCIEVTFPVDVVIIAWDGRGLGVGPYGQYNQPYTVPAGEPIHGSVARRFDALIRVDAPIDDVAEIKFVDTRGKVPGFPQQVNCTAEIPVKIAPAPPLRVTAPAISFAAEQGTSVQLEWAAAPAPADGHFHAYAFDGNGGYHWLASQAAQAGKSVYTFDWLVTQSVDTGYVIRVWYVNGAGEWSYFADSANTFEITPGSLTVPTVTLPNTGDPAPQGTVVPVQWTIPTPVASGNFHTYAFDGSTYHWLNSQAADAAATTYGFDWTVKEPAGLGYVVRVWYVDGSGNWLYFGDSSPAFEIEAGTLPVPTVTTPDTAGPFSQGAVVPVAWTIPAAVASGHFHTYAFDGSAYHWLNSQAANGSSTTYNFDWTVAEPTGTGYVVRVWYVDGSGNWLYFGDSSPQFEIAPGALPKPTVTLPNTSGPFTQGATVPVEWTVPGAVSSGHFHTYAFDGSYHWLNSQAADGVSTTYNFDWTVAEPTGTGYVVRVWYVDGSGNWLYFGDSSPAFSIAAP